MGLKFGFLVSNIIENDITKEIIKTPAVYIYTPEGYGENLIVSKESILCNHLYHHHKNTGGYRIYGDTDSKFFHFIDSNDNNMTDDDCDNIVILLDRICSSFGATEDFISFSDIEQIKTKKYDIDMVRQAKNNINIFN